ncbi:MAG TPA: PilZ domain-containing protein, partial [bacterium]
LSFIKNHAVSVQKVAGGAAGDRMVGQLFGGIEAGRLILGNFKGGQLASGDEIVVRMAVESEVLGFKTRVAEVLQGSITMYLVMFPDHVETINLRKSERLSLFIPVNVNLRYGGQKSEDFHMLQGVVVNLSRGGCCVTTKRPIDMNMEVRLHFTLPGEKHLFKVDGRVLRAGQKDSVFTQGVQFQRETENLPALAEVSQWITQNLSFSLPA